MNAEALVQEAIVALLKFTAHPRTIYYAVPNGEARSPRTGAKLKRMGVLPGVGDIGLVLPGGQAAFLEVKTAKGRLSPAQREFRDACANSGALFASAKSLGEAREILTSWGALKGSRPSQQQKAA